MSIRRTASAALAGTAVFAALFGASPAFAGGTHEETYPETPALNPDLPIVHTKHGSDHIKANVLNPNPVCNSAEDYRTVVYKVKDSWAPVGTISTNNKTKSSIPLTQSTSRSQTISLSVNGSKSESTDINLGGSQSADKGSVNAGIAMSLAKTIGGEASYSLSWEVGQQIGPYDVPAGHTGEATYGFRTITMTGTQQYCKPNGTWSNPTAWTAFAPIKNEVRVRMYDNPSGAEGGKGTGKPVNRVIETKEPSVPKVSTTKPAKQAKHDLKPRLTVASGKAPGYAGLAALRVKNVGSDTYYQEFPQTSFLVKVKTDKGPKGVDRLITPGHFNGAYTRDLGFDKKTSTRTFQVTLSNAIEPGEEKLVANLNFGDGKTKLGRISNYIEVSQVGRLKDDKTGYNDYKKDSRKGVTFTDGGKKNAGLF